MSADRLLAPAATDGDRPTPDARIERKRVLDALNLVIDDLLGQRNTTGHPVADALVQGFTLELAQFAKFVRGGGTVEAFALERAGRPELEQR